MRHRKKLRKLGRTSSHRKATLIALTTSLLRHKRIRTTLAKARETRLVVEKIITRAKNAVAAETAEKKNVHARRIVARYIKDREVVSELFGDIAAKVATRPGGYTRVIKLGQRFGDGAEVAIIELVDFNAGQEPAKDAPKAAKAKKPKEAKGAKSPKRKKASDLPEKDEKAY
jgi:large subunit ribosomal protein L17